MHSNKYWTWCDHPNYVIVVALKDFDNNNKLLRLTNWPEGHFTLQNFSKTKFSQLQKKMHFKKMHFYANCSLTSQFLTRWNLTHLCGSIWLTDMGAKIDRVVLLWHTGVKSKIHSHSKVSKTSKTCPDYLQKMNPLA